jgi:CHAT domain-containing protein
LLMLSITPSVEGQAPARPKEKPIAPGLMKLTGDDEKRATQLDEQIETAVNSDHWEEALARAEDLMTLHSRAHGPEHPDAVDARWLIKALRKVSQTPKEDRAAFGSLGNLKQRSFALFSQRKYAEAQTLTEKVLETYRRLLTDDHPLVAGSYNDLAFLINAQGKYAQAQPLYEKALQICRRLLTDDHPSTAAGYNNLAYTLNMRGKYADAQPLVEKALEIRRRLFTDDHADTANSYDSLAYTLGALGKNARAQPLYEKALEIRRRLLTDDNPDTATSYNNVASNLSDQGKHAEAQPLYEKALEIFCRLLTENHRLTAVCYNGMAQNLRGQGKYAEAQPLLEKALQIPRQLFTDNHPDTALGYDNLAVNLSALGRNAEAQPLMEKALEIRRRLLGGDHPATIQSYNNVAYNLSTQGKHAEAQALLEKALEIDRRLLTDNHPDTARDYSNLARTLNSRGRYATAQPLFEKALEIRRRLFTDAHPDVAQGYNNLAFNLYLQGKYSEARDRWLAASKSQNAARLQVAFAGLERVGFRRLARPALAAVLARLKQPADAFQALEEDLGRGLLDELVARQDRRLSAAERIRLRELTGALEQLDKLVNTVPRQLDEAGRAKKFEELRRQRQLASVALGEFQTKLAQSYGASAGQVASLNEIRSVLPADAAFVAWVDVAPPGPGTADPDGEHWGVVVRSRGTPIWVPISGTGQQGLWTEEDSGFANRVREELRNRPREQSAQLDRLLDNLRKQRLEPLATALDATADGLPPARKLVVLPSRAMAGIPIELLLAANDTRMVAYAPSATVYKYLTERPRPDRHAGLLALGDPIYSHPKEPGQSEPGAMSDRAPATGPLADQRKLRDLLVSVRSGNEQFAPLPGTRHEVEAITKTFQSDDRATRTLLAALASEVELDRLAVSGELGRFGFIHLATHSVINEAIPERSAVILTQTNLPDPLNQALNHKPVFDGRLAVREIQRTWDLNAELVTLSACDTARGREAGGEGFVGFTQALLMSGARSVCLSMWKVDDNATSLLMARFYQNLLGNRSELSKPMAKAEALQEAKRWLRNLTTDQVEGELASLERGDVRPLARGKGAPARNEAPASRSRAVKPYNHPYYWAAFVLVGDPD